MTVPQVARALVDLEDEDERIVATVLEATPELMARAHVPGVGVAVARRGRVIWEAGFGYADLSSARPWTPDTVFRSGSMGKTYTATAVMQLVERGLLDLEGEVSSYVGFSVENPLGERAVTVEDLLTHRSGLLSDGACSTFTPPPPLREHLRQDLARGRSDSFRGEHPRWTARVGEAFQYTNTGVALLGLVVESVNREGLTFGEYVRTHILEPLVMPTTRFPDGNPYDEQQVPRAITDALATGHAGFGAMNLPSPLIYFQDFPAGLVLSIPREHVRLLLAYLNGGELDGARILEASTVEGMLKPRTPMDFSLPLASGPTDMALIWMRGALGQDAEWFGHGGSHMYGWHNDFRAYPNLDLAITVTTNRWDIPSHLSGAGSGHLPAHLETLAAHAVIAHRAKRVSRPEETWDWKRSYLIGMSVAFATQYFLGIDEPITASMLDDMARTHVPPSEAFEPAAFRQGVLDVSAAVISTDGLLEFVDSQRCRLTRGELGALWWSLGGGGTFPLPMAQMHARELDGQAEPSQR